MTVPLHIVDRIDDDTRAPIGGAPLTNMPLAMQTLVDCIDAPETSPRLGVFFGFSGYGKTTAAAFAAAQTHAVYLLAQPLWTQRSFLEAIARELGIARLARNGSALLDQVIEELRIRPRPIVIDEVDYLVKDRFVEIIRTIHDHANVAILMIGEEQLPAKLRQWERFDNRILAWTPAMPASDADALALRDDYCRRVRVADDLALYFGSACRGVTRRIAINLQTAENLARAEGLEVVDRAWWGDRPVKTGDIPTRRSMGGR